MDSLKQLITFLRTNHLWVKLKYGHNQDFHPKDLTDPITKKLDDVSKAVRDKHIPEVNPADISRPIVAAQDKTTEAIKGIVIPEVPKHDNSDVCEMLRELKEAFQAKEMTVNVAGTTVQVDTAPFVEAIEKMEEYMKMPEAIDYTPTLDALIKAVKDKTVDLSEIERLLKALDKDPAQFPEYFKLDKNQLAQLIPISMIHSKALNNAGAQVNPATEETLQGVKTAVESIPSTDVSALATSAGQAAIEDAITNKDIMLAIKMLMQKTAYPGWYDRSANAIRSQIASGTVTAVTTVTTVTGLTNIDSYQGRQLVINQNNSAWASVVRARIT